MNDLEITKLCAEAMEIGINEISHNKPEHTLRIVGTFGSSTYGNYWPLRDKAQAMALVERFRLTIYAPNSEGKSKLSKQWIVERDETGLGESSPDLNRAICECVAKLQAK